MSCSAFLVLEHLWETLSGSSFFLCAKPQHRKNRNETRLPAWKIGIWQEGHPYRLLSLSGKRLWLQQVAVLLCNKGSSGPRKASLTVKFLGNHECVVPARAACRMPLATSFRYELLISLRPMPSDVGWRTSRNCQGLRTTNNEISQRQRF